MLCSQAAASEKRKKLADPNNFVSSTRLSIRNLPTSIDAKELKNIVVEIVGEKAHIKQVKIVCDKERNRRSKGFGFVELGKHEDALTVLRHLNNNPDTAGGKQKRPIVEFAVENVLKLQKLQHSMQDGAAATGGKVSQQVNAKAKEESQSPKVLSRRQKQSLADKQKHQLSGGSTKQAQPGMQDFE